MDDYDISNTLTSVLLGAGEDGDYGRVTSKRSCLLLDKVMEGKPLASHSRLLALPNELLADIVDRLWDDKSSLASLALVNSDCRQLARSVQFADIRFVYSIANSRLIIKLLQESIERAEGRGGPSIGACIRRITVETAKEWVANRHPGLDEATPGRNLEYRPEEHDIISQEATKHYVSYRTSLAIAIRHGMPNIETLDWLDKHAVDGDVWSAITGTSLRSLRFYRLPLDKSCRDVDIAPGSMNLHTLDLNCHRALRLEEWKNLDEAPEQDIQRAYASVVNKLLSGCAPTLRALDLNPYRIFDTAEVPLMGGVVVEFPKLGVLRLGCELPQDALDALLRSPIKHIDTVSARWKGFGNQHIPSLESASVGQMQSKEDFDSGYRFLKQHPQLKKLRFCPPSKLSGLDQRIIPLLGSGLFSALTSLALSWDDPSEWSLGRAAEPSKQVKVKESSLAAIGRIESLEQLSLSVGIWVGWRFQWAIDHRVVRRCFKPLKNLRRLAIERDGYPGWDRDSVQRYYQDKHILLFSGENGMSGMMEEMVDLRLRPELDDHLFRLGPESYTEDDLEDFVDRRFGQSSQYAQDSNSDGEPPVAGWDRRHTGGVTDRYAELDHEQCFEIIHRNRMLKQAELYSKVLPRLEWLLSGQWPMQISRVEGEATATPVTKGRDLCRAYLDRTFGAVDEWLGGRT